MFPGVTKTNFAAFLWRRGVSADDPNAVVRDRRHIMGGKFEKGASDPREGTRGKGHQLP